MHYHIRRSGHPIPLNSNLEFRQEEGMDETLFTVVLKSTSVMSSDLTGFVYKVQDMLSGNVTYIWQVRQFENNICKDQVCPFFRLLVLIELLILPY